MTLTAKLSEDRRSIILRVLAEQPNSCLNEGMLEGALETFGHQAARDVVRTEAAWLAEQGLVSIDTKLIWLVTLTRRGADVARGRAIVPGVKRPDPAE